MSWNSTRTLLDRLGVKLDHAPQDRTTREARLDILNRFYRQVCDEYPWRFLQTESDLKFWQERDYTLTGASAQVTAGSYEVVFSTSLGEFISNNYAEGLTFNDGTDDYTIGACIGADTIYLSSAYAGASGNITTWKIKTDKALLPLDCGQPLGFIDRTLNKGRLVAWDRRREELFLSPEGESSEGDVWWIVDGDFMYDRPPDPSFRGALSTAAGSLTPDTTYQYCYTFDYEGRESMPSVIVEVTTGTGATNQIVVSNVENTRDGIKQTYKTKNLYRRIVKTGSNMINGRWLRLDTMDDNVTSYTDDGSVTPLMSDEYALHYEGPRQFVRPRRKPAADQTIRVRYARKPKLLVADSDVVMGPPALADYIVIRAAMEIAGTNSERAKSMDWERQAAQFLATLKENYLQVPDVPTQRQRWAVGWIGPIPLRAGVVTGDFGT